MSRDVPAIKGLALGLLAIVCCVGIWNAFFYRNVSTGGEPVAFSSDLELISHGGAGLPAAIYSNSRQALDAAAARGFKKIELDLMLTSDDKIVASHDWSRIYLELHPHKSIIPASLADFLPPSPPTHAEFMNSKIAGTLDPIDLSVLSAWLQRHPDMSIIVDTKVPALKILKRLADDRRIDKRQIIAQIYHQDELEPVRALGFSAAIYTLYKERSIPVAEAASFALRNHVPLAISGRRLTPDMALALKAMGVSFYVHSVNDGTKASLLARFGAAGIYTDFLYASAPR